MTTNIQAVDLIFKTHLDLGFTDLARDVERQYFEDYIPGAINTAENLRRSGGSKRFIWTTGAWLIFAYLERAPSSQRRRLESAIDAGDIVWHALPFTMHSEFADESLFRHGLTYAKQLDARFGRKTIAGKMTDVPGHTRAIVSLLAEAGIEFLHIGINEASAMPNVPPVFIWRDENTGSEIVVMYQHSYGELMLVPGMDRALCIAHTNDNRGPQTEAQIHSVYAQLGQRLPQARIMASTLDDYARVLLKRRDRFPVVTQEIGDSWIHGLGSDPRKVAQFRALSRLRREWLNRWPQADKSAAIAAFSDKLLLVSEHTWGMDDKTHLADYGNYNRSQFEAARCTPRYLRYEASWQEQRAYLGQAIDALADSPMVAEAQSCLASIEPREPDRDGYSPSDASLAMDVAHFEIGFDGDTGAINHLREKATGTLLATREHQLGLFGYQTFSQADYSRFLDQYVDTRLDWALPDFSKPGLDATHAASKWWHAAHVALFTKEDTSGRRFILKMEMPREAVTSFGCPKRLVIEVVLPHSQPTVYLDFQWFDKPASRLPEAMWFSFVPKLPDSSKWVMDKMGTAISPLDVVLNGGRKMHAVQRGVACASLSIDTLDAPLVAPGQPSLLNFDNALPSVEKGMHFNLYNNVWGTNFPMWYEDAARFRFMLSIRSSS